jgi:putative transposase
LAFLQGFQNLVDINKLLVAVKNTYKALETLQDMKTNKMKLEVLEKDCYYHIYNRGINGINIFEKEDNKIYFLKQVSKYLSDKISIFAYCLMNNHFHLVIRLNNEEKEVTQAFSNLFNSYAKAFNKQTNRTGSLFEKHFKRIKLKDESYLKQLIVYIHLNPKHHFDLDFKDFKFSSYPAFFRIKTRK